MMEGFSIFNKNNATEEEANPIPITSNEIH